MSCESWGSDEYVLVSKDTVEQSLAVVIVSHSVSSMRRSGTLLVGGKYAGQDLHDVLVGGVIGEHQDHPQGSDGHIKHVDQFCSINDWELTCGVHTECCAHIESARL